MKKLKTTIPLMVLILLAGNTFDVGSAEAKSCNNNNECCNNITNEQRKDARDIMDKAYETLSPIRRQLFIKGQELKALQNASAPDIQAVSQKASEISELREKFINTKEEFAKEFDKVLGLAPGTHSFKHYRGHGMQHKTGNKHYKNKEMEHNNRNCYWNS